jgi:hypothetical protein
VAACALPEIDHLAWTQAMLLPDDPDVGQTESKTLRYRLPVRRSRPRPELPPTRLTITPGAGPVPHHLQPASRVADPAR